MVSEIFTNYIHIHPHPNILTQIKNIRKIGNLVSPENGNLESATTQLRKKRVKKFTRHIDSLLCCLLIERQLVKGFLD